MVVFTFFYLRPEIFFLGKFGQKSQNCPFKLKFGSQNNSNMVACTCVIIFCFTPEKQFWDIFGPKLRNCLSEAKFCFSANSNMQNLIVILTFHFQTGTTFFSGKFGPINQNCQFKLRCGSQTESNDGVHFFCFRLQ